MFRLVLNSRNVWCLELDWNKNIPKHLENVCNEWFEKIKELKCRNISIYNFTGISELVKTRLAH